MLTFLKKQPSLQNIAANNVAFSNLVTGGKHHGCWLMFYGKPTTAQLIAAVGDVVVKVNGKERIRVTATQLLALQALYGYDSGFTGVGSGSSGAGIVATPLFIPFAPYFMQSSAERSAWAWGTSNVSITVEVNLAGTITGVSGAEVAVYSEIEPVDAPLGQHIGISKQIYSFAATGQQDISDIARRDCIGLAALHLTYGAYNGGTTSTISSCNIIYNGANIYDHVPFDMMRELCLKSAITPQTGLFTVAWIKDRNVGSFLPMSDAVTEFTVQPVWATTAPLGFTAIYEKLYNGI